MQVKRMKRNEQKRIWVSSLYVVEEGCVSSSPRQVKPSLILGPQHDARVIGIQFHDPGFCD
jgi:hypothetical protein